VFFRKELLRDIFALLVAQLCYKYTPIIYNKQKSHLD